MSFSLLIYIPTYNRFEGAIRQVCTIGPHIDILNIKCIVQDNSSTDPKYEVLRNKCSEYGIDYRKTPSNLGGNPNILWGFLYCELADYVWILSDDDLLSECAVSKISSWLQGGHDLLYMAHKPNLLIRKGPVNLKELIKLNNEYGGIGLISQVIYKSSFIKNHIRAGFDNIFSCFPHLAILYEAVSMEEKCDLYFCSKGDLFLPYNSPPSESSAYVKSFFGYTLLSNHMEKSIAKEFLVHWWKKNAVLAVKDRNKVPEYSSLSFVVLKKYIKLFSIRYTIIKIAFVPVFNIIIKNKKIIKKIFPWLKRDL